MSGSYLAVAIDHGSSFDQYLAVAGSMLDRAEAKRRLAELVSDSADALVVEWRYRPSWQLDWPGDIWWGAPDQLIQVETPHGHLGTRLNLDDLDLAWLSGVKIGVNATGADAWERVVSEIAIVSKVATDRRFELIFEPYFAESDTPALRAEILERVTRLPQVRFAKLDMYSSDLLPTYTGASTVPWLARSDGRTYGEYLPSLVNAVDEGCAGCMVGAGLWVDLLGSLDNNNINVLRQRIMELRGVLDKRGLVPVMAKVGESGGQSGSGR
jgi:hypothetical protein